jgi:GNAT superfamily N-acetyltransferase
MDPILRLATPADADLILPLMRDYYTFDGHSFEPEKARGALVDLLRDPAYGLAWLIFYDAAIIGYVVLCFGYSLEYHGRDAFLDEFYLVETHRRRGIGTKVLREVENAARAAGVRGIHLEVVRRNQAAGNFYRKSGFAEHEHRLLTKRIEP